MQIILNSIFKLSNQIMCFQSFFNYKLIHSRWKENIYEEYPFPMTKVKLSVIHSNFKEGRNRKELPEDGLV